MTTKKTGIISTGIVFFWAGFVCSISFMEAWLKFQAPGVTLPIGLSIGKKVFTALNRVEWAFLLGYLLFWLSGLHSKKAEIRTATITIAAILFIQTFFLLPALSERANLIINGQTVENSPVHILFGIAEIIKVAGLIFLGFRLYRHQNEVS